MAAAQKTFQGRVITVTGAARGIGLATVQHLLAQGASVSFSDISAIDEAISSLEKEFPSQSFFGSVVDITDASAVDGWINTTKKRFGKIDGSVNNAGVPPKTPIPISHLPQADWDRVIGMNLTGCFNCLRAELNAIEDNSSIVNVASVSGIMGGMYVGAYIASKHGVIGLTKAAAYEAADRNIRVNAVCPAMTDTNAVRTFDEACGGQFMSGGAALQLFNRVAEPADIAPMIVYLLSDESTFVTKAVLSIDGGFKG
ncbi:3-oxoacyl-reductase [Thozetella sp. PMI_491]|nr:3-oxoacyl-reductase [Thozetella sp. PMI_491]